MNVSHSKIRVCGCILAGGKAGRIGGIAKGLIETASGTSIIDTLAVEMKLAGVEDIVLSAIDAAPYEGLGFQIVTDHGGRIGPIGGIEAVLDHFDGRCDAVILMPCDVPNIRATQIRILIEKLITDNSSVVIPRTAAGHFHPLSVVVGDGIAGNVSDAVKNGRRKVMDVWLENNASIIDFEDESVFQNINTHADLKNWSETKPDLTDKVA